MEEKKEEKSFSLGRLDIVDLYEWKNLISWFIKHTFNDNLFGKKKIKEIL